MKKFMFTLLAGYSLISQGQAYPNISPEEISGLTNSVKGQYQTLARYSSYDTADKFLAESIREAGQFIPEWQQYLFQVINNKRQPSNFTQKNSGWLTTYQKNLISVREPCKNPKFVISFPSSVGFSCPMSLENASLHL